MLNITPFCHACNSRIQQPRPRQPPRLVTDLAGPDQDVGHGDAGEGEHRVQRGRQQRQHEGVAEAAVQPGEVWVEHRVETITTIGNSREQEPGQGPGGALGGEDGEGHVGEREHGGQGDVVQAERGQHARQLHARHALQGRARHPAPHKPNLCRQIGEE